MILVKNITILSASGIQTLVMEVLERALPSFIHLHDICSVFQLEALSFKCDICMKYRVSRSRTIARTRLLCNKEGFVRFLDYLTMLLQWVFSDTHHQQVASDYFERVTA